MSASQENRPFLPEDFDEPCEECKAPAGAYCRPGCGSGYTADDARTPTARQTRDGIARPPAEEATDEEPDTHESAP